MRIGLLAPPFVRVPPERYGGTERVVAALADSLVERGHDVIVFASANSVTKAHLEPIVDGPVWDDPRYSENAPFWTLAVDRAYGHAQDLEIMHNHADFYAYPLARRAPFPTVTTQHWRMDLPELAALYEEYAEQPLVAVSDAQRAPLPRANWIATVYHGLPRRLYRASERRGSYLVFCGRLSRDKGAHTAIQAAIRTGLAIKIAGRRPTGLRTDEDARAEREYYADVLAPLLRHPLVEELGEIGDAEKQDLFAGALATLFPIEWPEPFGLVLVESLACGTPVLATPVGSVPEVITDGATGFHCRSVDDYVRGIERIDEIDRARCRAEFDERFTAEVMAAGYEEAYARVLGRGEPREPGERRAPDSSRAPAGSRTGESRGPRRLHAVASSHVPVAIDGTSALDDAPERALRPDERRRFAANVGEIFAALGMPLGTAGTHGTPERYLAALEEATAGYAGDPKLVTTFPLEDEGRPSRAADQVVEGPIHFFALCEHHALPFFGDAFVGYVPAETLLGLSKLTRLVRLHARRFTLQERLAAGVARDLERLIGARGVAVRLEARHLCTQMRGVAEPESTTRTMVFRGTYETAPELRHEFLRLCRTDAFP